MLRIHSCALVPRISCRNYTGNKVVLLMKLFKLLSLNLAICLSSVAALATTTSSGTFSLNGYYTLSGSPAPSVSTPFVISVYDPNSNCYVYSETQNITPAAGYFTIQVGTGTPVGLSPTNLVKLFDISNTLISGYLSSSMTGTTSSNGISTGFEHSSISIESSEKCC